MMFLRSTSFALAALALLSTACATEVEAETAPQITSAATTSDQRSGDVTVLQAWIGQTISQGYAGGYKPGDFTLDINRCHGGDCSGAVSSLVDSYLIGSFEYEANRSGLCELVELRTVIRKSAFDAPSFTGIGFFLAGRADPVFVSKANLEREAGAGTVTLKDGQPGLVHRLVYQGTCFGLGGNGGSLYRRNYTFRPYAAYAGADGVTYRNWDEVPTDYLLGRATDRMGFVDSRGAWVQSFDRQADVLR
jgi:hypothetical protein